MNAAPSTDQPTRWSLIVGVWTAYGLVLSAQHYLNWLMTRGVAEPWWQPLLLMMPVAWVWALATPAILWLGRRFPLERGRRARSVAVHCATCVGLVALLTVVFAWHRANVLPPPAVPQAPLARWLQLFTGWLLADGLLYWFVVLVGHARERDRRFRERELAASQLETRLAQADLHALKAQLHPHFLFNALHTIGSLVRTGDRDNAVLVVAGLGDLLRRLLDGATRHEARLEQELSFIRSYLDIERIRFRDRLSVSIDVAADVLDARVPHLILQPLVENAIRHGIAPRAAGGHVAVIGRRAGEHLELIVRDDGPGLRGAATTEGRGPGIGLANTRARLAKLYADDYRLDITGAPGGGLEARVTIPLSVAWFEAEAPA